jgi:hydroxymethylpyrimidine/phosphomethylpyrimidine kinase
MQALKARLILQASVLTPNVPEAEALTGLTIRSADDLVHAALMLHTLGPRAVLAKGGHLDGDVVTDVLVVEEQVEVFTAPRIASRNTHGTGCTLSSAIATGLAQGMALAQAVARARAYVRAAIVAAPGLGAGNGPLGHGHTVRPFTGTD